MSDKLALSISHLHKDFRLPHERKNSLKEWVLHFKRPSYEKLHALRDINLEVKKGEFFGIVGRNGSGKSTLLKIIAGIYQPTHGQVRVNGTLTPFIELGIGFNPELTGRENVYLNGVILGLTRRQVEARYQEIVNFAELEKFMDQRLKNYSSGMQVRLAFAIAKEAHNDILLIDEVLAVGDAAFQRKCYKVFKDIKQSGKTVIFVTHDMAAVQEYCDRAMMIQDSKVLMIGKPREVALRYEVANAAVAVERPSGEAKPGKTARPRNPEIKLIKIETRANQTATTDFRLDDDILVDIDFKVNAKTEAVQFNLFLVKPDGIYLAGINTIGDLGQFKPTVGKHRISCKLSSEQLPKGEYFVNTGVYTYAKPPRLIDILDTSYGENVPKIMMTDRSLTQSGEFFIKGEWGHDEKVS
ncbi:TPA: ABC transporter ATP-binding protein [Candidatus Saccharibacteria bacterium]|nr:MAG: ABC transporter-related protein [Candidatus Saccharibacteria bacterium GW2011_GWA2_46_10]OGL36089.1 MAG: hypothetical protein A3F05_00320 [Candidatus Saccharibacteria bacterium RIFCSPHIGHO2_12_FULL_47_17]HCM52270.1 ABC transporter ATP-binding protein [Candidatus Saccharibacteria bacterium]